MQLGIFKVKIYFFLVVSCTAFFASTAQEVSLKLTGGVQKLQPINANKVALEKDKAFFRNRFFYIARFLQLPTEIEKQNWAAEGLTLGSKLSPLDYYISTTQNPDAAWLSKHRISHIALPDAALKISQKLQQKSNSAFAKTNSGKWELLLLLQDQVSIAEAKTWLLKNGFTIEKSAFEAAHAIRVTVYEKDINILAQQPFVVFIQPINGPYYTLNQNSRSASRAFSLNASLANGGRNLQGQGIVAGVGDDADPTLHPDVSDRIINHTGGIVNNHGTHTTATIAGGGILIDWLKGYAPMATVVSQFFAGILDYAAQYVQDYDMIATNNSYANTAGDCYYNGVYDLYSNQMDQQAFDLPNLLNVFAAGNSGNDVCSPYPANYGTVLGSYQSSKNTLCVGRADLVQVASQGSSVGPVKDGRIKPDLCVLGQLVSAWGTNTYSDQLGTSMSAPGVTGALVLLNERYRQLNVVKPRGDLMKNLLLNGARDIGRPGPDYKAGFGLMHLENSLRMLENKKYFAGALAQNAQRDTIITVPAGLAALKVMLYWHDPAANPLATKTLVNDLDLQVKTPSNAIVLPKILNANPANVTDAATEGEDHINNVEQVVILNPVAGNYTISVRGFSVSVNPTQAYTVTFDAVPVGMGISVPFAGDSWEAGAAIPMAWDDEGTTNGTYTLEYSIDNGANWTTSETNIPATERFRFLTFPVGTATTQARVRLSKTGGASPILSGAFTVIGSPAHSLAPTAEQCPGYIKLNWQAVAGADDYEVFMKQGPAMVSQAITAGLTYTISGLSADSTYYTAVRARKNGKSGRYNYALIRQPNNGSCTGNISNDDLALDSIIAPTSGRQFTASALSATQNIQVRVRNLDDVAITGFNLIYSINNGGFTTIPVATTIAAGALYTHTITGINMASVGVYIITAVVKNTSGSDLVVKNDTGRILVKQLANPPLTISTTPRVENFDASGIVSLQKSTLGIDNLAHWDYANSDKYARARTFVNTGFSRSGNRAITLDVSKALPYITNPLNYLIGTFNLSPQTTENDLRFDFAFAQHGTAQAIHPQNKVWVRGSETATWVEAYDLGLNQPQNPGEWKQSKSIELSDLLAAVGQNYTSSTQIRFGQWAQYGMADLTHLGGLSFDDVRLYLATNDAQLLAIDTPGIYSCGLNAAVPVKITVRNSMNVALNNVPVSYTINGGVAVNEIISSIPANTNFQYEFITKANFQGLGNYTLQAAVNMPNDNVVDNNSMLVNITNQQVINAFPYFENFENGPGGFYANGLKSSWQLGTPGSVLINKAASGANAWKTTLAGTYNAIEHSYLYSPCFNITGLSNPTLSFSLAYDIEDCTGYGALCDAAWVEYSSDGISWVKLGTNGQGTNWYDNATYQLWMKRNQTHWHVASIPLPKNLSALRLRIVMQADDYTNYEGIAIDDIHIYDNQFPIYSSAINSNAITQNVAGNGTVNFTDAGKIIASILPANNTLGQTESKAWINSGGITVFQNQYYGARTVTVKAASNPVGPVKVRYYFTDTEANALRLANGCNNCKNPTDYTRFGITQYTNINKTIEDGDLTNNAGGAYKYYLPQSIVMVPYDAGYYAEFSANGFSEFWLNDGNTNPALATTWLNFTAIKLPGNFARLNWTLATENNILQYEIEVAENDADFSAGKFVSIGKQLAKNSSNSTYSFDDVAVPRKGRIYYRIKQLDKNGNINYSGVKLLEFNDAGVTLKLYPNPVKQNLYVKYNAAAAGKVHLKITDETGRTIMVKDFQVMTGENILVLETAKLAKGLYIISLEQNSIMRTAKIIKS